jgi:hypothetical protein
MPVPHPVRLALWKCHQAGMHAPVLAHRFGLSARTVRHLLARFRLDGGPCLPRYQGNPGPCFPSDLIEQSLDFRRQHPDWGAPFIRVMLLRQQRWQAVPHPRTIQRWLSLASLGPAPAGRRSPHLPRSLAPHERWQVDACDQLRLANGQLASWLRLTDECSGAFLKTVAFPTVFHQVAPVEVRQAMRECFRAWGLPSELRLDNGWPWGGWFDLPTPLALDLAGLGLGLHYNDPRSPRQNSVVERSHQTSQGWVEPHTCADAAVLQARLDETDTIQRSEYPHRGARSRMDAYAGLAHSGRIYRSEWELQHWNLAEAQQYLAGHVASRRVGREGRVSVYDRRYLVGRVNRGKTAMVQYDPESREWLFSSQEGVLWCRHPAEQITAQRVRALDLGAEPAAERGKT